MRKRKIPRGARRLTTYAEFESYLIDFAEGRYPFMWIVGRPGSTKTESIQAAVRGKQVYYRKGGQLTPLRFFIDCYHHRGKPIILDDAEQLLDSRLGAKLISSLGDTSPTKQLSYDTASRVLGDVPPVYYTTSSLCIIANRATSDEAIQSRAVILYFDPTNAEIHRAVARWYWDQEIHDWFGQHAHRLRLIDVRSYVIAYQDRRAGRDWRRIILDAHALNRASCIVQDIEADDAYSTRESKAQRFAEVLAGTKGASRPTYFRLRKRLAEDGQLSVDAIAPIALCRTEPPEMPTNHEFQAPMAEQPPETREPANAAEPAAFVRLYSKNGTTEDTA